MSDERELSELWDDDEPESPSGGSSGGRPEPLISRRRARRAVKADTRAKVEAKGSDVLRLLLWGMTNSGKTALLWAVGHELAAGVHERVRFGPMKPSFKVHHSRLDERRKDGWRKTQSAIDGETGDFEGGTMNLFDVRRTRSMQRSLMIQCVDVPGEAIEDAIHHRSTDGAVNEEARARAQELLREADASLIVLRADVLASFEHREGEHVRAGTFLRESLLHLGQSGKPVAVVLTAVDALQDSALRDELLDAGGGDAVREIREFISSQIDHLDGALEQIESVEFFAVSSWGNGVVKEDRKDAMGGTYEVEVIPDPRPRNVGRPISWVVDRVLGRRRAVARARKLKWLARGAAGVMMLLAAATTAIVEISLAEAHGGRVPVPEPVQVQLTSILDDLRAILPSDHVVVQAGSGGLFRAASLAAASKDFAKSEAILSRLGSFDPGHYYSRAIVAHDKAMALDQEDGSYLGLSLSSGAELDSYAAFDLNRAQARAVTDSEARDTWITELASLVGRNPAWVMVDAPFLLSVIAEHAYRTTGGDSQQLDELDLLIGQFPVIEGGEITQVLTEQLQVAALVDLERATEDGMSPEDIVRAARRAGEMLEGIAPGLQESLREDLSASLVALWDERGTRSREVSFALAYDGLLRERPSVLAELVGSLLAEQEGERFVTWVRTAKAADLALLGDGSGSSDPAMPAAIRLARHVRDQSIDSATVASIWSGIADGDALRPVAEHARPLLSLIDLTADVGYDLRRGDRASGARQHAHLISVGILEATLAGREPHGEAALELMDFVLETSPGGRRDQAVALAPRVINASWWSPTDRMHAFSMLYRQLGPGDAVILESVAEDVAQSLLDERFVPPEQPDRLRVFVRCIDLLPLVMEDQRLVASLIDFSMTLVRGVELNELSGQDLRSLGGALTRTGGVAPEVLERVMEQLEVSQRPVMASAIEEVHMTAVDKREFRSAMDAIRSYGSVPSGERSKLLHNAYLRVAGDNRLGYAERTERILEHTKGLSAVDVRAADDLQPLLAAALSAFFGAQDEPFGSKHLAVTEGLLTALSTNFDLPSGATYPWLPMETRIDLFRGQCEAAVRGLLLGQVELVEEIFGVENDLRDRIDSYVRAAVNDFGESELLQACSALAERSRGQSRPLSFSNDLLAVWDLLLCELIDQVGGLEQREPGYREDLQGVLQSYMEALAGRSGSGSSTRFRALAATCVRTEAAAAGQLAHPGLATGVLRSAELLSSLPGSSESGLIQLEARTLMQDAFLAMLEAEPDGRAKLERAEQWVDPGPHLSLLNTEVRQALVDGRLDGAIAASEKARSILTANPGRTDLASVLGVSELEELSDLAARTRGMLFVSGDLGPGFFTSGLEASRQEYLDWHQGLSSTKDRDRIRGLLQDYLSEHGCEKCLARARSLDLDSLAAGRTGSKLSAPTLPIQKISWWGACAFALDSGGELPTFADYLAMWGEQRYPWGSGYQEGDFNVQEDPERVVLWPVKRGREPFGSLMGNVSEFVGGHLPGVCLAQCIGPDATTPRERVISPDRLNLADFLTPDLANLPAGDWADYRDDPIAYTGFRVIYRIPFLPPESD